MSSPDASSPPPDGERRRSFRVDTLLRLRLSPAAPGADAIGRIDAALLDLPLPGSKDFQGADPRLLALLARIQGKLSLALELLAAGESGDAPRPVNLSVTGLRTVAPAPFNVGDLLEIDVFLPAPPPPVRLILYGRVLRSVPVSGGTELALDLAPMQEEAENALSRHVMHLQREALLRRRNRLD